MTYDHRSNLFSYRGPFPPFDLVLCYLEKTDLAILEAEKYSIGDDSVSILVQASCTRSRTESRWESHQRYVGIQYLISGREQIGFQNTSLLAAEESYDVDRNIAFYRDNGQGFFVPMVPGSSVVCLPQGTHIPSVCADTPELIERVVIKIKVSEGNS